MNHRYDKILVLCIAHLLQHDVAVASSKLLSPAKAQSQDSISWLKASRFIDLSHPFDEKTLYWPTSTKGFVHEKLQFGITEGGYFYSSYAFSAPEHGGTHIDAPIHFAEGKRTLDEIPLNQLVAPAVVIDFTNQAANNADALVGRLEIEAFEKQHGRIEPDTIVLLNTGWAARWPDRKSYFGNDKPGDASNLHFPGLGEDGARLLVERKVAAVGIDTASIDHGPSKNFIAHRVLMGSNIPAFENLASMEELPTRGAMVIALPMKIANGSGGPLRIIVAVSGKGSPQETP